MRAEPGQGGGHGRQQNGLRVVVVAVVAQQIRRSGPQTKLEDIAATVAYSWVFTPSRARRHRPCSRDLPYCPTGAVLCGCRVGHRPQSARHCVGPGWPHPDARCAPRSRATHDIRLISIWLAPYRCCALAAQRGTETGLRAHAGSTSNTMVALRQDRVRADCRR